MKNGFNFWWSIVNFVTAGLLGAALPYATNDFFYYLFICLCFTNVVAGIILLNQYFKNKIYEVKTLKISLRRNKK